MGRASHLEPPWDGELTWSLELEGLHQQLLLTAPGDPEAAPAARGLSDCPMRLPLDQAVPSLGTDTPETQVRASGKENGTENSAHHCSQQQNSGNRRAPTGGLTVNGKALPKGRARPMTSTCLLFKEEKEPEPSRAFQRGHLHTLL